MNDFNDSGSAGAGKVRRPIPGFRQVPRTGVIYVMHQAAERGYRPDSPDWANLGQGAPETGPLPGAPPRVEQVVLDPSRHEYGPITGDLTLRERVAALYNQLYRRGKRSQYTAENVSISGGGRVALTRLAAALGNINMGHFLPDYTAYEELLSVFKAFVPIPILLDPDNGYRVPLAHLRKEVMGRGLKALLVSNPCNPTGQLVAGAELQAWVDMARELRCALILDEFYSHYIYADDTSEPQLVSAAAYVEDVDADPVILVDGLTKNWRYPGWRISWTVGPREVVEAIASAGSFLDGGANHPLQADAAALIDPACTMQETAALQRHFRQKRDHTIIRLRQLGIQIESEPAGTFYVWANLSQLPPPLNDGLAFFEGGLGERVITVPGVFFDVNPERRRSYARYRHYSRISFGPDMATLNRGLDSLQRLIDRHRA